MRYLKLLFILLALHLPGLLRAQVGQAPAFYYSKPTLDFRADEMQLAVEQGMNKLFLRYFNLDWSAGYQQVIPKEIVEIGWGLHFDLEEMVPCVGISNAALSKSTGPALDSMVARVSRKIIQTTNNLQRNHFLSYHYRIPNNLTWEEKEDIIDSLKQDWTLKHLREVQIDCEWRPDTRDTYFRLLRLLAARHPEWQISCTLSLQQYQERKKYGIPPVSAVALQCFNVQKGPDFGLPSAAQLDAYLKGKKYPLPVNPVLPLFNWGVWYRNENFMGVLWELGQYKKVLQQQDDTHLVVKENWNNGSIFLQKGDVIHTEAPDEENLKQTLLVLRSRLGSRMNQVLYFDWDSEKIKTYEALLRAIR
jgi:hypothetical protein